MPNWDNFGPEKWVVDCRDEEEWFLDFVQFSCHITLFLILLQSESRSFSTNTINFTSKCYLCWSVTEYSVGTLFGSKRVKMFKVISGVLDEGLANS